MRGPLRVLLVAMGVAALVSPAATASGATGGAVAPLISTCHFTAPPAGYVGHQIFSGSAACQKCVEVGKVMERQGWAAHCWIRVDLGRVELWRRPLG